VRAIYLAYVCAVSDQEADDRHVVVDDRVMEGGLAALRQPPATPCCVNVGTDRKTTLSADSDNPRVHLVGWPV
jgi:hypothetical protein